MIEAGPHIQVVGTGSAADHFVIGADIGLQAVANPTFNTVLSGLGTVLSPWRIEVNFASTAKLNDLPDVNVPAPTNGQVLGWNNTLSLWEAQNPTSAAPGAILHDTSLAGDGSAGANLQVQEDPAGFLTTRTPGLGVTDAGINQMVRRFPTPTDRAAASPAPALNTMSVVDTAPGQLDYFDGTAWQSAGGAFLLAPSSGQEMYQLSGPYVGGRLTVVVKQVVAITDADGIFDVIPATELASRAGIMSAQAQPTAPSGGLIAVPVPFGVILNGEAGALRGRAYSIGDGLPLPLSPVNVTVTAFVY